MADSIHDLQDIASKWLSTTTNNGMNIIKANINTGFMHINRRRQYFVLYVKDENLNQVSSYTYHDVLVDEGINLETVLIARND